MSPPAGIFDRFRNAKQTAAPVAAAGAPDLPARAKIATFNVVDAVGSLALEGGGQLRFGRSACKGFEPVVGASVTVVEVASDTRGWKARFVTLDPVDASYDSLLSARDTQYGLPSHIKTPEKAAAAARHLGIVTVLLREPLPTDHQMLLTWASAHGFPRDGFDINVERDLEFVTPRGSVITYPGHAPFSKDGLDIRTVGDAFDFGQAFIGLGASLPGFDRRARAIVGNDLDCWAPDSSLRQLSRLVCILGASATGVVLHRAGHLVVPIGEFVGALGDLDDPECRPFGAWLDIAITRRNDKAFYATFGMDVFGLPDVLATVDADDRWSRARSHEAVLYASYRMIRENRELRPGETLAVPVRLSIGAWPLDIDERAATTIYEIVALDGDLELVPTQEPDIDGALAVNIYQALFDCGLADLVPSHIVHDVPARSRRPLEHIIEVRARADGRGFLVVTNGFGRNAGFEIGAWVPIDSFELVKLVGLLAAHALEAPVAWAVGDTIAGPIEELGIGGFVIADGGAIAMGAAPTVRILLLVPLAETDYPRVRGGGAAAWLARNPPSEVMWAPFATKLGPLS